MVSLALLNSFTVYRKMGDTGPLLDFQLDVCRCLLKVDQLIDAEEDVTNRISQLKSLSTNQIPVSVRHEE